MDGYILKAEDQEVTKEALALFQQLGYELGESDRSGMIYAKDSKALCDRLEFWSYYRDTEHCKELTLPQLRDLVVLKRNDVTDANYTYAGNPVLKLETQDYKVWDEAKQAWLEHVGSQTDLRRGLKAIPKVEKDPALISGAEALRALADGKEVVGKAKDYESEWLDATHWTLTAFLKDTVYFKLKPQTIKLELELPKPFEPKEGEVYYYIQLANDAGVDCKHYCDDKYDRNHLRMGVWRTESEAKQALVKLEALRGAS